MWTFTLRNDLKYQKEVRSLETLGQLRDEKFQELKSNSKNLYFKNILFLRNIIPRPYNFKVNCKKPLCLQPHIFDMKSPT